MAALHPDLHWTEAAGFPYRSGTWHSPQEVVEKRLSPLPRDWDGFSAITSDFIVAIDRVVAFGHYAGVSRATGKAMRAPFVHDWLVRDGKLARFAMHTDPWLLRQAMEA